ncbi:MAG: hypothetical protein KC777_27520, partial [Cyanobacteria bacterium HKST-UBA02]|nr:hypothetical protein [Cyanobacteria bacterium HKST-UBA02]
MPARATMNLRYPWLVSARADGLFLFLPVMIALLAFGLLQSTPIKSSAILSFIVLQGLGLGPLHLGMTWAHFKDSDTRDHLIGPGKKRLLLAGAAVLGILGLSAVLTLAAPVLVIALFMATSIHHIAKQNEGILLLYHNRDGECLPPRELENRTIILSAWLCAIIFLARQAPPASLQQLALSALAAVVSLFFAFSIRNYLASILMQARTGLAINVPALMFWGVCVAFLFPFAFQGENYTTALFAPLVMHWFQYVFINWILVCRRQASKAGISLRSLLAIATIYMITILAIGING